MAETAGDPAPCGPTGNVLRQNPPALRDLVHSLQVAYAQGAWSSVRARVSSPSVASALVAEMRTWKVENVRHVTVSAVYAARLPGNRYVSTFRFEADPRAPPEIAIYLLGMQNGRLQVIDKVLGVCGPDYTRANWDVTRTRHFIVYHSPYQLVGADRSYLVYLEQQRSLFAQRFRVQLPSLAAVYLYPSQSLMGALTHGACGASAGEVGCTDPFSSPPTVHETIQAFYHEPIHIYQRSIEPRPVGDTDYVSPLFIAEGTAVALEDRQLDPRLSDYCSSLDYAPLDTCARQAVSDVNPMSLLSDKGFQHADPGDAYALGGSFVKYLMLQHGDYRFGRFYFVLAAQPKDRVIDYDVAARRIYGRSINALIAAWRSALCAHGC